MINDTNAGTVPATTSEEPESEIDQVLEFLEELRELAYREPRRSERDHSQGEADEEGPEIH